MTNDIIKTLQPSIKKYMDLRKYRETREAALKDELAPYLEAEKKLGAYVSATLSKNGLKNIRTVDGTAYNANIATYKIVDERAYLKWLIENNAWETVDLKPIAKATDETAEKNLETWLASPHEGTDQADVKFKHFLPPGLSRTVAVSLRVRTK